MKVALLTREFPPEVYGGAGVHVEYLSQALSAHVDLGVHCMGAARSSALVVDAHQPWAALDGTAPHLEALRVMSADLTMAAGVAGADLLHSHTWYANFAGHLGKLLYGVPHVCTAHSLEPLRPWKAEQLGGGYAVSSFCERTAFEGADGIIAVSRQMRGDILSAYPAVDPSRVYVIHNGIDPQQYQPDDNHDVLQRYNIDADRPYAIFVGRQTRQKGLTYLLDAALELHTTTQLVIAAGAADTPEMAAEINDKLDRLRAQREGVVVLGALERAEVIQLLSHAAVFVCPSIYEPFGLVNIEAMACGVPVVASAIGGIPEIVVDGVTGVLVPFQAGFNVWGEPADSTAFASTLAAAINSVIADPGKAKDMGAAGRQRAIAKFSWANVAQETNVLYERLRAAE